MHVVDSSYSLKPPSSIIFDWDNTLVDSWLLIYEAVNHTLIKFGLEPWSLEETKIKIHRSMKDTLPKYFSINWERAAQVYRDHYLSIQERLKPLTFAEQTLEVAQVKKIPLSILSNKKNYLMWNEIDKLGWKKYFACIVGSGDVKLDKPSGDGVKFILDKIHTSSNNIWFIGDSVTDMETAYNTGCVPVFFGEDDYSSDRYQSCRPKVHFLNHKLLSEYLKSL